MKKLSDILKGLTGITIEGDSGRGIEKMAFDSRAVESHSVFVAVRGLQADGHDFIRQAVEKGAVAIVAERWPDEKKEDITYILVPDSAKALGVMAGNFFGNPSSKLTLVGVTGTNGKTTVVTLLHQLFSQLGHHCGLISTVENKIGEKTVPTAFTTPDALTINALLAEMIEQGCTCAFMEVSSHSIVQERIAGLQFAGGIFTNITHEHLDFHKTFKAYIEAKKKFFDGLGKEAFALVNIDDKRGDVMVQNTKARVFRYGLRHLADFRARIIENSLTGLHLQIGHHDFYGRLIGEFNAYNLLSAYAAGVLLGQDEVTVLTALSRVRPAEGRFDYQVEKERGIVAIVDYAHTPDALEKVLETITQLRKEGARVITVIGCGGDRDKAKRPLMAKVACAFSDRVILTSDNPRTEDPEAILRDMEEGVPEESAPKVLTITQRRQAIRTACQFAGQHDIILVAGKGHEKYQEINGVKYPFDDKAVLKEELGI